ncbi:hypothetical protein J26TS2_00030 [Shouchella clausii]|nr:hypothetical protein J26TS2_00030 [Shouchella clausii]
MEAFLVLLFLALLGATILAFKNPKKFKTSRKGALLRFGLPSLIVFIIIGIIGSGSSNESESPVSAKPEPKKEEVIEEDIDDTEEELVDKEPEPQDPIDIARGIVLDVLGEDSLENIEVNDYPENGSKVVLLTLNGSDNLTQNLIYKGMLMDSSDLAERFKNSDLEIHDLMMSWQMPLVDTYGNEEDGEVLRINLSGETLDKINFDNFLFENFPSIADNYWEHPTFSN